MIIAFMLNLQQNFAMNTKIIHQCIKISCTSPFPAGRNGKIKMLYASDTEGYCNDDFLCSAKTNLKYEQFLTNFTMLVNFFKQKM